MIFLTFDTETTGMVKKTLPIGHDDQPRIVQLGMELHNGERVLSEINMLVDPGVPIPPDATKVHGVTDEMVRLAGVRPVVAASLFSNFARIADIIVAHNSAYDVEVMTHEFHRLDRQLDVLQNKRIVCTMLGSKNVLKIPGKFKDYKWPNLQEAYKFLIDAGGFEGGHDAMEDVRACRKVFLALVKGGYIKLNGRA